MLHMNSAFRRKLVAYAASVALVSGLTAGPAVAGSGKPHWLPREGNATALHENGRGARKSDRGRPPAHIRAAPAPAPLPPHGLDKGKRRSGGTHAATPRRATRPHIPGHTDGRERQRLHSAPPPPVAARHHRERRGSATIPVPPPPSIVVDVRPRHDDDEHDGRHSRHHKKYKHKQRHHTTHVTHNHVTRHYYRTSSRHYYYSYPYPQPYPVYYLVPYHIHTTPGYHSHGEETTYCDDGYRQGGVYRGGGYSRGASHRAPATLIGGILGGALGSQVGKGRGQLVAVGVGTVIGALIGNDVGRAMDARDRAYATGSFGHAMETAPTCTTISWNNENTGNYGSVTPVQTYEPEPGRYCREFQQQVVIGGKVQDAYGTACRQPDGSWEIVAEQP